MNILCIKDDNSEGLGKRIEANVLVDLIIGEDSSKGNLLTWGVNAKGRLGYKDVDKVASNSDTVTENGEIQQVQYYPKLVYFRANDKFFSCRKNNIFIFNFFNAFKFHTIHFTIPKIFDKGI